jgi:hypothetical protein
MKLPSGKLVYPSTKMTKHFTWSEATKSCSRVPESLALENNIINTAVNLEKIRTLLGNKPLFINSWYRPKSVNDKIKGAAKNSIHLTGLAVDFRCSHLTTTQIYNILDPIHEGGLGLYGGFCHIDYRNWLDKPKARWISRNLDEEE